MSDLLFDIKNMECTYVNNPGRKVLHIDTLQIPRGEIVFLVGPSGIGKSTILEALGFMNRTISKCDWFRYLGQDVSNKWMVGDAELSQFRRKEFSFIFQSNNLMSNFTAMENVMITALFQGKEVTEKMLKDVFAAVRMPEETMHSTVTELSGGQRQRLAFARAILPDFNVLFGDEPTGNLDPDTATGLMEHLHHVLKDQRKGSSAIIVSHDMRLAVEFADRIVQFHRIRLEHDDKQHEERSYYGLIDENSFYVRSGNDSWLSQGSGSMLTKTEMFNHLTEKQQ